MGKKNKKNRKKSNRPQSVKALRSSKLNTIILVGITIVGAALAVFMSH